MSEGKLKMLIDLLKDLLNNPAIQAMLVLSIPVIGIMIYVLPRDK